MRLYEFGAIAEMPREHLPIGRRLAYRLLEEAAADTTLPDALREQARYHLVELGADVVPGGRAVVIPTSSNDRSLFDDPIGGLPFAVFEARDSSLGAQLVLEPLFETEIRTDPDSSTTALLGTLGVALRGTLLNHVGFSARVANGSIAGDSALAARDPRIERSGAFGIAGFGRDIDFARGHLRVDFDAVAFDVTRELMQMGGGGRQSLLIGSLLPSEYDALRLSAHIGKVSFTHMHASLMPDISKSVRGVFSSIPNKFIASHLLSVGPYYGMRLSIGESVVYSERPFEIGYLNPFGFLRSQEHYYRDRDNANMYAALSVAPMDGIFLEAEFMLDDLKLSRIGDGFWGNKTGIRVGAAARAIPLGVLDIGLSYTRLQPYIYTHFSDTNAYTHDAAQLAAGGLPPNSQYFEATASIFPAPQLTIGITVGVGEHGANVFEGDTLSRNVGGDVSQTKRPQDSETVAFLDGINEKIGRLRLEVEYEPLRNVYFHLTAFSNSRGDHRERELRAGLRIGAR